MDYNNSMLRRSLFILLPLLVLFACSQGVPASSSPDLPRVLAVESFLADIAQNVAGERLTVETLLPIGADPHSYQPTPRDAALVVESNILIANGAGFETFIAPLLENTGGKRLVIEAAAGLTARPDATGEHPEGDPHFWLDPNNVIVYIENIRDGLSQTDPGAAPIYMTNAADYIDQLRILDQWITLQVSQIQPEHRLLVTNHESFGYFASRYGFRVVGAVIPSLSSEAAPSAQQIAALIDKIKESGAPAIFLETGANPNLAQQIADETGIKVVTGLYTHSISEPNGPAPSYVEMMKYNVTLIVEALK